MQRPIPGVLWVAIILVGFATLFSGLQISRKPEFIVAFTLNSMLLYGLIKGYVWAYYFTIIGIALGVIIATLTGGIAAGGGFFFINCFVLMPVLLSKHFFFSTRYDAE